MSHAPTEETRLKTDDPYVTQWSALGKMIRRGGSFSGRERNCCFLNTAGKRFADVSALTGLDFNDDSRAVALTDWDHDGDLDIWLAGRTAPRLRMLRNQFQSGNHFLAIKLQGNGVTCNRDAIGARLELHLASDGEAGEQDRPRIRTLRAGEGFISQSSKWIHFGLGKSESIERLVVRWPQAAAVEQFDELKANRRYVLVQGSGRAVEAVGEPRNIQLAQSTVQPLEPLSKGRVMLFRRLPFPNVLYRGFDGSENQVDPGETPVLVILWASWCPPCLEELTALGRRREILQKHGVRVVALNVDTVTDADPDDDLAAARAVVERLDPQILSGIASTDAVRRLTQLNNDITYKQGPLPLPASFLVDAQGRLAIAYRGPLTPQQLKDDIPLLTASPAQIEQAALPFAGRAVRHLLPEGEIAQAIALHEAGYDDQCQTALRVFLTPRIPRLEDADDEERRQIGQAYFLLATVEQENGRFDNARKAYRIAVHLLDDEPAVRIALFRSLSITRDIEEAETLLKEIHERWANITSVYTEVGQAWMELGEADKAVAAYQKAIELDPDNGMARFALAVVTQSQGKLAEALQLYRDLLADSNPSVAANARNNLSWIMATHSRADVRDPTAAVKLARANCEANNYRDAGSLDTLAAALAADGHFDEATQTAARALHLARATGDVELAAGLERRLGLYQIGRPFREDYEE